MEICISLSATQEFVKIKFMDYIIMCYQVTQDFFCKLLSKISYNLLSYNYFVTAFRYEEFGEYSP